MTSKNRALLVLIALLLIGCAQTSVTPLSRNQIMIHVNAAPVCGPDGASTVGLRTAAAHTLRNGFERFQVFAGDQGSDVMVINRPLSQGGTIITGRHSINLRVVMANPGDPMFANGLDARQILGDDWESYLEKDIITCN